MPGFAVDFSQVKDREAVPAGDYHLECVEASLRESQGQKTAGTEMLVVHWKIVGGEHDNARIFDNLLLGGDSLWRAKQFFEAVFGKGKTSYEMDTAELVGVPVMAKVVQDVWAEEDGGDGEVRNRIRKYSPFGGATTGHTSVDSLFK